MGKHWKYIEANAGAYKALGIECVYLSKYEGWESDYPWHLVTEVSEGGSHRMDISTDLNFSCVLKCGITVKWYFNLEPSSANGSGEYQIDAVGVADVLANLPPRCAMDLKRILGSDAEKVRARGDEYMKVAQRQYGCATVLERLAKAASE